MHGRGECVSRVSDTEEAPFVAAFGGLLRVGEPDAPPGELVLDKELEELCGQADAAAYKCTRTVPEAQGMQCALIQRTEHR